MNIPAKIGTRVLSENLNIHQSGRMTIFNEIKLTNSFHNLIEVYVLWKNPGFYACILIINVLKSNIIIMKYLNFYFPFVFASLVYPS